MTFRQADNQPRDATANILFACYWCQSLLSCVVFLVRKRRERRINTRLSPSSGARTCFPPTTNQANDCVRAACIGVPYRKGARCAFQSERLRQAFAAMARRYSHAADNASLIRPARQTTLQNQRLNFKGSALFVFKNNSR